MARALKEKPEVGQSSDLQKKVNELSRSARTPAKRAPAKRKAPPKKSASS